MLTNQGKIKMMDKERKENLHIDGFEASPAGNRSLRSSQ